MRWCLSCIGCLALCVATARSTSADVFPKSMSFEVRGGLVQGYFSLTFGPDTNVRAGDPPRYQVALKNFGGLGMTSDQVLYSYFFQSDLSLYGQVVSDPQGVIRQVFLDTECKSALGDVETTCFVYRDRRGGGDALQTELFAPYPAIDLVSSIVVATQREARGARQPAHFVFIFNDTSKKVTLAPEGRESLRMADGKTREATVWSLKFKDTEYELYRFYIAKDGSNGFIPAKMTFTDQDKGPIHFVAETWTW